MLNPKIQKIVLEATSAKRIVRTEMIQRLWSGYGKIIRVYLTEGMFPSVIVKHVKWPTAKAHPLGWNTDISHVRKVRSYEVETAWYRRWSNKCDDACRVPKCFAWAREGDEVRLVLEDLNVAGFPVQKHKLSIEQIHLCLRWLANFHGLFMGQRPDELWQQGTYWHLETRPDELAALSDEKLKSVAAQIDKKLANTLFSTFVHGDAKLANFCFSAQGKKVAAVDFQYVGGGCGMKDVAYFLGSCLYEDECEKQESELLKIYFGFLQEAVNVQHPQIDFNALEEEWRGLYYYAWTDFHRFIKGWSADCWGANDYSERLAKQIINQCQLETKL